MIRKVFDWDYNGEMIPIYEDPMCDDNSVLRGYNSDKKATYIICGPVISKMLYEHHISKKRDEKLIELFL